jgi:hypothetical protein
MPSRNNERMTSMAISLSDFLIDAARRSIKMRRRDITNEVSAMRKK